MIESTGGTLVGLVTSNARHISGRIIPTLNFSLPVGMLAEAVTELIEEEERHQRGGGAAASGGDRRWARRLGLKDTELSDVWNLEPPPFDIAIQGDVPHQLASKL